VALIPGEVFLVNKEVMVGVQLPKTTIQHVEVLIGKVLPHHVNVIFVGNLKKCIH
jgi:hypothetical protein